MIDPRNTTGPIPGQAHPLTVQVTRQGPANSREQAAVFVESFDHARSAPAPRPGRDEFLIAGPHECVFCARIAGMAWTVDDEGDGSWQRAEPITPVVEDWPETTAFRPLSPVTPLHTLVVPKAHVPNHTHGMALAQTMFRAAELARSFEHAGYDTNLIVSSGAAATQTVQHLHVHVVPRSADDGLMLPWGTLSTEDPTAPHRCRQLVAAVEEQLAVREALGLADFAGLDDVRFELARLARAADPAEDESRFEYTVSRLLGMDSDDFAAYRERNGVGKSPEAAQGAIYERLRERLEVGAAAQIERTEQDRGEQG